MLFYSYSLHLRSDEGAEAELEEYLASKRGEPFHFMEEALKYCKNDVLILALAVLSLEAEVLRQSENSISFIFSSSFTIAGLSAIFYRHLYMEAKSMGIVSLPTPASLIELVRFR